ncbi:histidine phosphatase family protein [Paraburkholderia bannensis]|uniref:histidine phosphatase family protein n=1 Tax=Paraburkholderia bannensis TaxID=765414 RepID=UPI002AB79196|nr:histidine phosphatase family protein [Paraburkholderia bannensis]
MATKVWLVSHAANADLRAGVLAAAGAGDGAVAEALDSLDTRAKAAIEAWRTRWYATVTENGDVARALTSPATIAQASAHAAGFDAAIEDALADTAFGAWTGRRLTDIANETPEALGAWTRDPAFRPPGGGESFDDVRLRVSDWLDALPADTHAPIVAFTHASVIRAAVLHALGAPSSTFRQLEIAPLSVTALRRNANGWVWIAATP